MKIRVVFSIGFIIATHLSADTLTVFKSNTTAKAAEVNANFALLSARIDSLSKALSLANSNNQLPIGTVAAFLITPGTDGYLPGSNSSWVIAAGQTVGNINVPDMRGRFLRGICYTVTGCSTTVIDPDGERKPGIPQEDAFQSHAHLLPMQTSVSSGGGGGYSIAHDSKSGWSKYYTSKPDSTSEPDMSNSKPRISNETRPKNVAVFWYVKVK
jgi:hypothetical protein